jgi:PTH1 family peptidyl-tRNA hydrolase
MYLVVGLGNPGKEYEDTRHNLGFKAIEELASRLEIPEMRVKSKMQAFLGEAQYEGHKVILAQPITFMNLSGLAVSALLSWNKIPPDHLILIYDDVDLEVGQVRVRPRGNAGGHHGVESVINSLGTPEFNRVRIGIGRESLTGDVTDYVLQKIPPAQRETLETAIQKAAEAALEIVAFGIEAGMNKFNA